MKQPFQKYYSVKYDILTRPPGRRHPRLQARLYSFFISLIFHAVYDRPARAAVIHTAVIISHTLRTEECLFYGRGAFPEIQRP